MKKILCLAAIGFFSAPIYAADLIQKEATSCQKVSFNNSTSAPVAFIYEKNKKTQNVIVDTNGSIQKNPCTKGNNFTVTACYEEYFDPLKRVCTSNSTSKNFSLDTKTVTASPKPKSLDSVALDGTP